MTTLLTPKHQIACNHGCPSARFQCTRHSRSIWVSGQDQHRTLPGTIESLWIEALRSALRRHQSGVARLGRIGAHARYPARYRCTCTPHLMYLHPQIPWTLTFTSHPRQHLHIHMPVCRDLQLLIFQHDHCAALPFPISGKQAVTGRTDKKKKQAPQTTPSTPMWWSGVRATPPQCLKV